MSFKINSFSCIRAVELARLRARARIVVPIGSFSIFYLPFRDNERISDRRDSSWIIWIAASCFVLAIARPKLLDITRYFFKA
jgi:hypothetical protein